MNEAAPLRVCVGPGLRALEDARLRVVSHLARSGPCADRATVYAVELVLEEWLTNVFRHGGGTQVTVEVDCDERQVALRFSDDGITFDPTRAPEREAPATLDEAEPGGLGLFLIHRYSRSWCYARESSCNVMRVEIDCRPA